MQISELKDFASYEKFLDFSGIEISVKRDENGSIRAIRINDAILMTVEEIKLLVDMARFHSIVLDEMKSVMRNARDAAEMAKEYYN